MLETKRPPQNIHREIIDVPSTAGDLALHVWQPHRTEGAIKGAVFYFHGLQSHAGWLWEAGPRFADNDIAFFVLDRRGSGISPGPRHEIPDTRTVLDDYAAALAQVRELIGDDVPLSLFGHCLGGSFMAALMHDENFTTRYDAAIFCSTWLGRLHATHDEDELLALAQERSEEPWNPGLKAADFTDEVQYQHFIDHDDLAVRELTRRSRTTLLELEQLYLRPDRPLPDVPATFVSGMTDPIVDLDATHEVFHTMLSGRGCLMQLPTDKHYLFYTDVSDRLIDWASTYTLLQRLDRDA
ncbi:alpha/beta fold hydrolase [Streptomyces sp. H27-D2]|uniref:alpha/beta fold hydrolase n=1 Tax=Streptomyces sp. H27-D2 TaxID=3046304 RepID=UPI002DB74960|nr:alpha/beta fold hydrolase [Streptomyces sp. H27-D2]MEC4015049.1 alpha/beta fold hydrolase [Streptomyces sp. H27-D2]